MLKVQGSNRIGVWSPHSLKIPIRVLPSFWQTPWFIALVFASALALAWLILRWRTHALHRSADRLQGLVLERTALLESSNASLQSANSALETAQQRLIATQEKLLFQEKMAGMAQLVAGVAHEVNTPLGIAVTASSFLQQRASELTQQLESGSLRKSELERFASDADSSSQLLGAQLQRAVSLITQFKQLSFQQNFDAHQSRQLAEVINDAIRTVAPHFANGFIQLDYAGAPDIWLETYTGALAQVISQLLQNALTHAFAPEQAGKITLSCALLESAENPEIEIIVADDGIGIDSAQQAKVFEPFFTTKRNLGSTGLGLHIAFNLVTARLGGSISVLSTPNKGSIFTVQLPARLPK